MLAVVSKPRYQRARLIFEAAEGLAESSPQSREVQLLRLDLYRQAASWLVLAHAGPEDHWPSVVLFELGVAAPIAERLTSQSPLDDEQRDDASVEAALQEARGAVVGIFEAAEAPAREVTRRERKRVERRMVAVAVAMFGIATSWAAGRNVLVAEDLAKGKPWRTSSKYAECHPEVLECGGARTSIFFHTREEQDPWVEVDLGAPTDFTEVVVHNRSDGVPERAVPLVLEVSDDRQQWRELARRDELFKVWQARLPPTRARFVRLRVPRVTYFHLDAVKVHR